MAARAAGALTHECLDRISVKCFDLLRLYVHNLGSEDIEVGERFGVAGSLLRPDIAGKQRGQEDGGVDHRRLCTRACSTDKHRREDMKVIDECIQVSNLWM